MLTGEMWSVTAAVGCIVSRCLSCDAAMFWARGLVLCNLGIGGWTEERRGVMVE